MKKLEEKIIEKTYRLETRQTLGDLIIKVISLITAIIVGIILIQALMIQYAEQQTLDLLQIFNEDFDVFKNYLGEVLDTIYQETPKDLMIFLIVVASVTFFIFLTLTKNFGKIKNKLRAIRKHRHKKYE